MWKKILGDNPWLTAYDYLKITLGLCIYSVGYTCFMLPYQIISGGLSGIATLVYYSIGIHANVTYLTINILLLLMAVKVLGWRYFVRTIYATLLIGFLIGVLQNALTTIDPVTGKETITHVLGDERFMSCVIGGLMEGLGLAIVFLSGGSTGGTDIIASSVNKFWDISLGRMLLYLDIIIITSSYLLEHSIETVVIGYVTMFISMNFLDFIVNGARQSVQFTIISNKHEEIAQAITDKVGRGITILHGEGWYSKEDRQVLLVMAKKYESRAIFQLVHEIDPAAFLSMSNVEGVFGEGFDKIKTRKLWKKSQNS